MLDIIEKTVFRSIGCTDPVALALAAVAAYREMGGRIEMVTIAMDRNIYKNSLRVGIPGTDRRGAAFAVALGLVCGDSDKGLSLFDDSTAADIARAEELHQKKIISLTLIDEAADIHIRAEVKTDSGTAAVTSRGYHDNIVLIEKNGQVVFRKRVATATQATGRNAEGEKPSLSGFFRDDLVALISHLPTEGVTTNLAAAEAGSKAQAGLGLGSSLQKLMAEGLMADNFIRCVNPNCGFDYFVPFCHRRGSTLPCGHLRPAKAFTCALAAHRSVPCFFLKHLMNDVLLLLPHRQYVWTFPRALSVFFKHDQKLFGEVSRLIFQMIQAFYNEAAGKKIRTAAGISFQTAGEFFRFNSHYHGIILEGGFDEEGNLVFIPFGNLDKMSEYFRPKAPAGRRCPQGSVDAR